jgi:hypothetical protein
MLACISSLEVPSSYSVRVQIFQTDDGLGKLVDGKDLKSEVAPIPVFMICIEFLFSSAIIFQTCIAGISHPYWLNLADVLDAAMQSSTVEQFPLHRWLQAVFAELIGLDAQEHSCILFLHIWVSHG